MFTPTPHIHFLADLPKPPADRPRVGCPYPKLGHLRCSDTSNKALARSPKLDFPPTLPQIHDDGSLEADITDALAASPNEYGSLQPARSLFSESSQESETSDRSPDLAPTASKRLAVAEVAQPVHRQVSLGRSYRFRKLLGILSTPPLSVVPGEPGSLVKQEKALPMPPTMASEVSSGSSTSDTDTSSSEASSPGSSRAPSVFA